MTHMPIDAARHLERPRPVGLGIAQIDGRPKHQQIHDEVQSHRKLTEYLVGGLHRRQHHEHDRQGR